MVCGIGRRGPGGIERSHRHGHRADRLAVGRCVKLGGLHQVGSDALRVAGGGDPGADIGKAGGQFGQLHDGTGTILLQRAVGADEALRQENVVDRTGDDHIGTGTTEGRPR